MRYVYRCRACRARVRSARPPTMGYDGCCPECGDQRMYIDRDKTWRGVCTCDGGLFGRTGSIPHRPGSPCCIENPNHVINRARAMGATAEDLMDLMIDIAWESDGGSIAHAREEVPF